MRVDRAYCCDSPFQVFTCIHMELHQHTCSDMYILDAFKDAGRIVGELRKRGLFRKVVLIGTERVYNKNKTVNKRTLKSSLGTFGTYFDVREIVEGYIEKDAVYDEMYFSCNQLSFRLARFYFIKKGYPTRFVMYDEGAGSYDGHFERVKFTDAFVRRILFGKRAGNSGLDLYLYQPELYFAYEKEKHRLHKICPFDETDKAYLDDYNAIFNSIAVETAGKHIYFDTLREEVVVTEEALVSMQQWYDMIEDALGAENILVKPHPRAFRKYPHNAEDFAASDCPMEINYLSMDLDDLGLISLLSTAAISPKLIYDKEPRVLILCNVDKNVYKANEDLLAFYRSVKALYRDPDRFMIPENMEELKECLKVIAADSKRGKGEQNA